MKCCNLITRRQMCRPEVGGGTPTVLLLQNQSNQTSLVHQISFLLDVTARAKRDVWLHTFLLTELPPYATSPPPSQWRSLDQDKRLNLILRILKLITPRSQGTSCSFNLFLHLSSGKDWVISPVSQPGLPLRLVICVNLAGLGGWD